MRGGKGMEVGSGWWRKGRRELALDLRVADEEVVKVVFGDGLWLW